MNELVQENTRIIPNRQTSLTKEQKEAISLLSIGTFLEYFDHWGILIIMLSASVSFAFGLSHFENLRKERREVPLKIWGVEILEDI